MSRVHMNTLKYGLRRFLPDILTTLVAVLLAWVAFQYANNDSAVFLLTVVTTLAAALVIVYFRVRERDFYYESLTNSAQQGNWVGYGTFGYSRMDGCFRITGSDSGFLFTKTLSWSDYELRFRFKILQSCLGVIVRAVNLSNLVMLQITTAGIRPHIRINGAWRAWEIAESKLDFRQPIDTNTWQVCAIKCDKDSVRVRLTQGGTTLCDKAWKIPRGTLHFELQDHGWPGETPCEGPKTIPFAINLEYGTVGFRNDGTEEALVRDVLIERILV